MIRKAVLLSAALCLAVGIGTANAIPVLQIYIEGATYNATSETWVLSGDGTFRLWVVGDVGSNPAGIEDVMLAAAVNSNETGTITVTGAMADGDGSYNGVNDPSTSAGGTLTGTFHGDGSIPLLGDGSSLQTHGIYGAGTSFYQYSLDDFTLTDSNIGDFSGSFPSTLDKTGQINAYDITVTGFTTVHFDAFDHIEGGNDGKFVNAPFSHDGQGGSGGGGGGGAPEPGTMALFGLGLAGLAVARRK